MQGATLRQAAILVGGLGTRLGALTADTPKPLLPVAGKPFLAWLLRELSRFGVEQAVLLTGHLAGRVRESVRSLGSTLPKPMELVISEEPFPAGTGGALWHARHLLDDRFLLCNGDSLLRTNLARLLANWASDAGSVTTTGPEIAVSRAALRPLAKVTVKGPPALLFTVTAPGAVKPGSVAR